MNMNNLNCVNTKDIYCTNIYSKNNIIFPNNYINNRSLLVKNYISSSTELNDDTTNPIDNYYLIILSFDNYVQGNLIYKENGNINIITLEDFLLINVEYDNKYLIYFNENWTILNNSKYNDLSNIKNNNVILNDNSTDKNTLSLTTSKYNFIGSNNNIITSTTFDNNCIIGYNNIINNDHTRGTLLQTYDTTINARCLNSVFLSSYNLTFNNSSYPNDLFYTNIMSSNAIISNGKFEFSTIMNNNGLAVTFGDDFYVCGSLINCGDGSNFTKGFINKSIISGTSFTVENKKNTENTIVNSIVVGYNHKIYRMFNTGAIFGEGNKISEEQINTSYRHNHDLISGLNNSLKNGTNNNLIIGETNTLTSGNNNVIAGLSNTSTSSSENYLSGYGNSISNIYLSLISGKNNTITPSTRSDGSIIVGENISLSGSNSFSHNIITGIGHTLTVEVQRNAIFNKNLTLDYVFNSILGGADNTNINVSGSISHGSGNYIRKMNTSLIVGANHTLNCDTNSYGHIVGGDHNSIATGGNIHNTLCMGRYNVINNSDCLISGQYNRSKNDSQIIGGHYNLNDGDYYVSIGGGTGEEEENRKDVFYVKRDGSVYSDNDINVNNNINVKNNILINGTNIFELIYPVGSIYISKNSTNPATLFGVGTWSLIKGKYIYGADPDDLTNYPVDDIGGGSKTISTDNIPELTTSDNGYGKVVWSSRATVGDYNHNYSYDSNGTMRLSVNYGTAYKSASGESKESAQLYTLTLNNHNHTIGNSTPTDYMQPYIVRYIWERIE